MNDPIKCLKDQYRQYITEHINNVQKMYSKWKWLFMELFPEVYKYEGQYLMESQLGSHDASKYSVEEFEGYRQRFFPLVENQFDKHEFNRAWLHHIHNNPHHPEYWVLYGEDGPNSVEVFEMPEHFIIEMICDWLAMCITKGGTVWEWYYTKGKDNLFGKYTRLKVERAIEQIKYFSTNTL